MMLPPTQQKSSKYQKVSSTIPSSPIIDNISNDNALSNLDLTPNEPNAEEYNHVATNLEAEMIQNTEIDDSHEMMNEEELAENDDFF